MKFISTRGEAKPVGFVDACLAGLAPDGGLYVPESWPQTEPARPAESYVDVAARVIGAFAGYTVLAGAGDVLTGFVLAVFAGLLLTATIEDIVPEADQPKAKRRISSPSFALGFGALRLTSAYLGQ